MKNRFLRIFGIALTLALVASMFVFASPVSAVGKSDNANSFEIWFDYTRMLPFSMDSSEWSGKPIEVTLPFGTYTGPLTTVEVPGQFNVRKHPWPFMGLGDFGPYIGYMEDILLDIYVTAHINYNVPQTLGEWDLNIVTDAGTLFMECDSKRTIGFWTSIDPEDPAAYWPSDEYRWRIVDGTGVFENMIGAGDYNVDTGRFEGVAHYLPDKAYTEFQIVRDAVDDYLSNGQQGNISAASLFALIDDGNPDNDPYIVDMRSQTRYNTGHIPGAVFVPFSDITSLPLDEDIVIYCFTGQTASTAKSVLGVLGYDVTSLSHGMCGWTTVSTYLAACFDPATKQFDFPVETAANIPALSYPYPELDNTNSNNTEKVISAAAFSVTSKKINADALKASIDAGGDMTIIDMRSSSKYASGHIPGAINVSLSGLVDNLIHINPDAPVCVYCYTGQTAGEAVALLNMLGYDAYSLNYGFCSWSPSASPCFTPPSTDYPVEPSP